MLETRSCRPGGPVANLGSERTSSEAAAIRDSEARYRELADTLPETVFETDITGRLTFVNSAGLRQFGACRADLEAGIYVIDHIVEEDRARVRGNIGVVLAGHPAPHEEYTAIRKDGSTFPCTIYSDRVVKDGRPSGLRGFLIDLSAQKQAEREIKRTNRALACLSECNQAVVRVTEEGQLLQEICRIAVEAGGYSMAWVGFADLDGQKSVRPVAWLGSAVADIVALGVRWSDSERGNGPAGRAIRFGEVQVFRDVLADPRTAPWRARLTEHGVGSLISLPLVRGSEPFGALTIGAREVGIFDEEEVRLLTGLASNLAYGIVALRSEAARREADARLSASLERVRGTLSGMVQAISAITELRDPHTAGHQRRVSRLARAISQEMGLTADEVEGIRVAAVIHDIGKITVPAEILSKPGRLTAVELQLIRAHAEAGYDILKGIEFPWPVAEMVRQHHERLDGSGYPLGLRDDAILLGAKIIAVADVIEAVASHRPYRAALGLSAAKDAIELGRGTRYAPRVVEACLRTLGRADFRFE